MLIKKIIKTNLLFFTMFIICLIAGCVDEGFANKLLVPEARVLTGEDCFFVFVDEVQNADGYTIKVYDETKQTVNNTFKITTDEAITGYKVLKPVGTYYITVYATDSTLTYYDSNESEYINVTIEPTIKNIFSITYVLDGGTIPANAPENYTEGVGVSLPVATKENAIFVGWYLNADFSGNLIKTIDASVTGDVILYAYYAPIQLVETYTITYVLNGGTIGADAKTTYQAGDTIILVTPTKTNATFDGWYLNADFSGEKIATISNQTTGDLVLYAKWIEKELNLSDYYKSASGLTGVALKKKLRTIISTGLKTVSYNDLKKDLAYTDEDPNNSNNLLLVYSHISVSKTWNPDVNWNREHMWPQSKAKGWFTTSGAGSDIHHLRPEDPKVNSTRGNRAYGKVNGGKTLTMNNQVVGYYDTYFEPLDEFKGDVARIILYMLVRYAETDSAYPVTNVFQSFDLLLEWHQLDPVDEFERVRNERCYSIQKNRNPFIDYPEFADLIWN